MSSTTTPSNIFQSPSTVSKKRRKKKEKGAKGDAHPMPTVGQQNPAAAAHGISRSSSATALGDPRVPSSDAAVGRPRSLSPLPPIGAAVNYQPNTLPSRPRSLSPTALPSWPCSLPPLPPTAAADQSLFDVTPTTATANILSTMNRSSSQTDLMTNNLQQDDDDFSLGMEEEPIEEQSPPASGNGAPSDWENVSPNQVMARLKLLKAEVLDQHDLRPFYKSYSNWEKMSGEQKNKAVAWFRKLPEPLKGSIYFIIL
jgi:hypothetical protein